MVYGTFGGASSTLTSRVCNQKFCVKFILGMGTTIIITSYIRMRQAHVSPGQAIPHPATDPTNGLTPEARCGGFDLHKWPIQSPRIIGGHRAFKGQFPWLVELLMNTPDGVGQCGGLIVHQQWILTAAHCVYTSGNNEVVAVPGRIIRVTTNEEIAAHGIYSNDIFVHPGFINTTQTNDIALVHLRQAIKYDRSTSEGCYVGSRFNLEKSLKKLTCYLPGFGTNDKNCTNNDGSGEDNLQYARLTLTLCKNVPRREDHDPNDYCRNQPPAQGSHCWGDSGGPVMCFVSTNRSWIAVAIVSSTIPWNITLPDADQCASSLCSEFMPIAKYSVWIQKTIGDYDEMKERLLGNGFSRFYNLVASKFKMIVSHISDRFSR